jgi:hypothetical protein
VFVFQDWRRRSQWKGEKRRWLLFSLVEPEFYPHLARSWRLIIHIIIMIILTTVIIVCTQEAGRLLYAGQDDWVHVNCALWSAEVFEEQDGTLQNVHVAMVRGRQLVSQWQL